MSLFFLCRTIFIDPESNLILFTSMQKQTGFKIKTINLDTDIFTQEKRNNNKLTVPLIRSLTQRKNREHKKVKDEYHERSSRNVEKEKNNQNQDACHEQFNLRDNEEHFQHFTQAGNDFLKRHNKTNPSNHKNQCHTDRKHHFKRYNHSHSHSIQCKNDDPELFLEAFEKDNQQSAQVLKDSQKESPRGEDRLRVNPYTKDQYIYMRNRQMDEIMQLKRSAKLTRMNSITKSYRVATINLTPQIGKRANSLKMAMPNIPNKGKTSPFANALFVKSTKKQSEIKPWEWIGPEESKQYLM